MSGHIGTDDLLRLVSARDSEFSQRLERLESMCRVAISDLERLLRMAARAQGVPEGGLEERVRTAVAEVVPMAARRALEGHRSALEAAGRAEPGATAGT